MSALMTLQGTLQQWQLVSHANEAPVRHFLALSLSLLSSLSLSAQVLGLAGVLQHRGGQVNPRVSTLTDVSDIAG